MLVVTPFVKFFVMLLIGNRVLKKKVVCFNIIQQSSAYRRADLFTCS